jgi:hypothetical protein
MTGSARGLFWVALVVIVVIGFAIVGRGGERSAEPLAPGQHIATVFAGSCCSSNRSELTST